MDTVDMIMDEAEEVAPPNIIMDICKYLSFEELKRVRRVSKTWNETIIKHPRFINSKVWFTPSIYLNRHTMDVPRLDCTGAKLQELCLGRTLFMRTVWRPRYQMTLKKLDVHRVRIKCLTMVKFINALPVLEELSLSNIHYKKDNGNLARGGLGRINNRVPVNHYCTHIGLPNEIEVPANGTTRTIRKISFIEMSVIPTCILQLLRRRCSTVLQEFEYRDAPMPIQQRGTCSPLLTVQENNIRVLLSDNVGTLTKLIWKNNGCGNGFIQTLSSQEFNNMNLREITLAQHKEYLDREGAQLFLNFLLQPRFRPPASDLTKLELGFTRHVDLTLLRNIITPMIQLEALHLRFKRHSQHGIIFEMDFRPFQRLHSIEIIQSRRDFQNFVINCLNPDRLPNALQSLVLDTKESINMPTLSALLATQNHRGLTKLMIGKLGTNIGDSSIQLLIRELPFLEDLSVTDATNLTDFGFTGLPLETVTKIIKSQSYDLIFGEMTFVQPEGTQNLKELKHLRRLNLSGCRQVSDVSIGLAFIFPYLREIDLSYMSNVTDLGIMYLTKKSPGLEKVILKSNNKVSNFGLNQLVKNSPTLTLITTSQSVYSRSFIGVNYPQHFRIGASPKLKIDQKKRLIYRL